jgi:hypothetical protein
VIEGSNDRIFKRAFILDIRVTIEYHLLPNRTKKQGSKVSGNLTPNPTYLTPLSFPLLMKKLILTVVATSLGISLFAQGTVTFDIRSATLTIHVYAPLPGNPFFSQIGNGPNDIPPGTTQWAGFPLIGASGGAATTYAQLLGAPGYNVPESGLLPGLPVTTFRTGTAAGAMVPQTSTFNNIAPDAPEATLEMVTWDNSSGLYPTWTQASFAWLNGLIAAGKTGTWNQDHLGGSINLPPHMINSTDPTQHAQSFNLYFVPEPTTAALAGLGATVLLILRRRK